MRCSGADASAEVGKGGKAKFKVHAYILADSCVRNYPLGETPAAADGLAGRGYLP